MSLKFFLLILSTLIITIEGHYEKYDPKEDIDYVLKNQESVFGSCCKENIWNETMYKENFGIRQKRGSDFECDTPLVDDNLLTFASNVSTFTWDYYKLVCILI